MSYIINKKNKGFALVEILIALVIVAVVVVLTLRGGGRLQRNAYLSKCNGDLTNFSIAASATLSWFDTEGQSYQKGYSQNSLLYKAAETFDKSVGSDFKLNGYEDPLVTGTMGEISIVADSNRIKNYVIFESIQKDPWGNPYFIIISDAKRSNESDDLSIIVISAGPNKKANIGGQIDNDDLFLLAQQHNTEKISQIYDANKTETFIMNGRTVKIAGNSEEAYPIANYVEKTNTTGVIAEYDKSSHKSDSNNKKSVKRGDINWTSEEASKIFSWTSNNESVAILGLSAEGKGNRNVKTMPDSIDNKPVTSIEENAFKDATNIYFTKLPNSIRVINNNAFDGCTNLMLSSLPSDIEFIGSQAFRNCKSITFTSIPSSIIYIENETFLGCSTLPLSDLPENLVRIGDRSFEDCPRLRVKTIPSTVNFIGTRAFYNDKMVYITSYPSGCAVGSNAFSGTQNSNPSSK